MFLRTPSRSIYLAAACISMLFLLLLSAGCRKKPAGRKGLDPSISPSSGPFSWVEPDPDKRIMAAYKPVPPQQKGVALGLYCEDSMWSYEPLLREIAQIGASHVSLVVAYYLDDIYSSEIRTHGRYTSPDSVLSRTMEQARALGLRVMLFPILRVLHKPGPDHWRGNLKPRDRLALGRSYVAWMGRLARLAQKSGVEVLSVGSELSSLDTDPSFFGPVVKEVRSVFKGKLTYSANWDHFRLVRIFPLVDLLGLCGYFGIAVSKKNATLAEMVEGWRDVKAYLVRWARTMGKPLLFTEVGYMSQQQAARDPWEEAAKRPLDLEEQRRAYEAFVRVWSGTDQLAGVYFWNWYGWGGPKDRSYTPRRKPASRVICRYYGCRWPIKWYLPD